jgi:hypothetical protein
MIIYKDIFHSKCMAGIDYKAVIDGMKWEPTPLEIELNKAMSQKDKEATFRILMQMQDSPPPSAPLVENGLREPVFYSFLARAEWEMLGLADSKGAELEREYGLHPSGQQGVGLNWRKLNERIWIPADYLDARLITEDSRAIFSHDEASCIFSSHNMEDASLFDRIIRKPPYRTGKEKTTALITDPNWRTKARDYSVKLLNNAGNYLEFVTPQYRPVLEAMRNDFRTQMYLR